MHKSNSDRDKKNNETETDKLQDNKNQRDLTDSSWDAANEKTVRLRRLVCRKLTPISLGSATTDNFPRFLGLKKGSNPSAGGGARHSAIEATLFEQGVGFRNVIDSNLTLISRII